MLRVLIRSTVVAGCLFAASLARADWPPAADAPPESLHPALLAEVRAIALDDRDSLRRGWAWRALRQADDPELATCFERGLADESPQARAEALRSLLAIVDRDDDLGRTARRAAVRALDDPSTPVVQAAEYVIFSSKTTTDWSGVGLEERYATNDDSRGFEVLMRNPKTADLYWRIATERIATQRDESFPYTHHQLIHPTGEAPGEHKARAVAFALASPLPMLRYYGAMAFTDPVARLEHWLADADPLVRRYGLDSFDTQNDAAPLRPLYERALFDPEPSVRRQAILAVRNRAVEIDVDRAALLARLDGDQFPPIETAVMTLLRLDTQNLGRAERIAYLATLRERFAQAERNGRERRLTAGLLARFVVDQHGGDAAGPIGRGYGQLVGLLAADVAIPHVAKCLVALTDGARDPDPYVRFVVCKAIGDSSGPALHDGKLTPEQAAAAWRAIAPLARDENERLRNAFATRLPRVEEMVVADPECKRDLEAAALALLADPKPEIARAAARFFGRHGWRPEAAPVLAAEAAAVGESDDFGAIKSRSAAGRIVLRHSPDSVSLETTAALFAAPTLFIGDEEPLTEVQAAALDRLLRADALELVFQRLDRTSPYFARLAVVKLGKSGKWDSADVADAISGLERIEPELGAALAALAEVLTARKEPLVGERLTAILRATAPRSRAYALLDQDATVVHPGFADAVAAGDPVACLLGIGAYARREPGEKRDAALATAPGWVRTLAAEAARRRVTGDVGRKVASQAASD